MNKFTLAFILGLMICSTAVYAQGSQPSREDPNITADVRNKVTQDEMLRGLIIDLVTEDGVVTLNGTVASQAQADRAVEVAKKTDGVVSVVSKLTINETKALDVGTPTPQEKAAIVEKGQKELDEAADISDDVRITNEVKMKFAGDDLVKSRNVRITATEGVVALRGTVRTKAEEEQAITLANSVPGVKEVRSEIVIDPAAK